MITWKITRSRMNNNITFLLIKLLLGPFYISYNTYKHIYIDADNVVFSLIVDFRKALDYVSHQIWLLKLNTFGIL